MLGVVKRQMPVFACMVLRQLRLALLLVITVGLQPSVAAAKVYFYTLTRHGDLVKYDPETDRLELKGNPGKGYITPRLEDSTDEQQTRILDMARLRLATIDPDDGQPVLINLQTKAVTQIPLGTPGTVESVEQFIYPRRASRFYVHWVRRSGPTALRESLLTAVGLDGQVLGTSPAPIGRLGWPVYHPNGRDFYVMDFGARRVALVNGETLGVVTTHDLTPLVSPDLRGPGIIDIRDGKVLLAGTPLSDTSERRPWTVFTTDLTFNPQTASPRIATGLSQQVLLLLPGAQVVLLQETLVPPESSGAGRLHFFNVASGTKLGLVEFPAPQGANLLGFHPDGRRLFIPAFDFDAVTSALRHRLIIVDVVTRTVVRNRVFERIGVAVDFVDEPQ